MTKKKYPAKFKFSVVMEALRSPGAESEVARQHGVHPVTLSQWKKQLLEHGHTVFETRQTKDDSAERIRQLERMLGQKEVELALMRNFSERS